VTTKVVGIVSEKGGVGKTTVITNLGVAAHLAGLDVAIIDLDPQTNAADWFDERGEDNLPEAVAIPPNRLKKFLEDLRTNGTDLVLIDTPRESGNAGYVAAENADLVLVPYKRGGHDLRALDRTLNMCRLAGKRPYLVLNGIRPGATQVEADTRGSVAGKECEVAPVVLHHWTAYETTSITARTPQETDPGGPVAGEIKALYVWLAGQLGLPTTPQSDKRVAAA
jgi:chromosome partitioning protein